MMKSKYQEIYQCSALSLATTVEPKSVELSVCNIAKFQWSDRAETFVDVA
jgi:hypothetical protein